MEAVVALAVIGLVAVALLATTAAQVRTADKAQQLLTARALADERMATVRSLDYFDLTDMPDSLEAGTFAEPFDSFSWRADVTAVEGEYDLFTIGVVVMTAGDAFTLRTLVHQPRPVQAGAAR